ncbi:TIGR00725 family protein [Oceanibaculum nanhaiense]|uniref:TIGR00725 family protein n=1 Tax=Oceanibaculum nanhaiense TaxID=1909734 RepID=UPI00396E914D
MYLIRNSQGQASLADAQGRHFDPASRSWGKAQGLPTEAHPVSAEQALCWLQRESGHPLRPPIGVIGPREASDQHRQTAGQVGRLLARCGFVVICGGRQGVMEAVCEGVAAEGGVSIGLLPDEHWDAANPHVTIPIATGIGVARNAIIARAAGCLIAIGGGYGTHSEMAFGLQFERPVIGLLDAPDIPGTIRPAGPEALAEALLRTLTGKPDQ